MKIVLKSLTLTNFKGIRSQSIAFNHITNIFGENGTGKTTIFDAFLWLFFGKDSTGRKEFEIKTLDADNTPYHKLEHEVSALISVDGEDIAVRRVLREKWVTKRGSKEEEFDGHDTACFWNDVPLKVNEYQAKIAALLDESLFKMITNTSYFNSLKWEDRRNVLLQMAGTINNTEILDSIATISNKSQIAELTNALNLKKSIEEFKREITAKKKKVKDEKDQIPSRIDEAKRSLPDVVDYGKLEEDRKTINGKLAEIETSLTNLSESEKNKQNILVEMQKKIGDLKVANNGIEFHAKNAVRDKKQQRDQLIVDKQREYTKVNGDISAIISDIERNQLEIESQKQKQDSLRTQYTTIDAKTFEVDDNQFKCPTCLRPLEATDIESKKKEMLKNFNDDKSKNLIAINNDGLRLKDSIGVLTTAIENLKEKLTFNKNALQNLQSDIQVLQEENTRLSEDETSQVANELASHKIYQSNIVEINTLQQEISNPQQSDTNRGELLQQKETFSFHLSEITRQMSLKEQREKTEKRIKELESQEESLAQELANLEGTEFCIEQFTSAKMNILESRINGKFKLVKFRLFREQINGGVVETCDTLIGGVPFPDANNAARINAGLDIINTLCEHYNSFAPIFIDNRESVVTLGESQSQIVNLIVSGADKKLRVA